jgi:lysophospholipase L1-like esterase
MNTVRSFALLLFAFTGIPALAQLQYVPLQTPCRAVDTRLTGGALADDSIQVFDPGQACGIPSQGNNPIVFAMNVTVVPHGGLGALTVYPAGLSTPLVSTLNSYDGRVKSNYALVAGGGGTGDVSVWASNATDVILDVSGYFVQAPATGPAMLYTPVTPCRLIDTRNPTGQLGGPYLSAGKPRNFSLAGQCGLPDLSNGGVLSVNVTAVPRSGTLGYLTVWGTAETENTTPISSTLNSPTGTVVANTAFLTINPGTDTSISADAFNDTDFIVDVTGYFSEVTTGLAYYPTAVLERILDTRTGGGAGFTAEQTIPVSSGTTVAVLNATVVPSAPIWYLTLYPDGIAQPLVSTLNSYDATVTSNMAVISTGADGAIDAFADGGPTQLILDLSGSFKPLPTAGPVVWFFGDEVTANWNLTAVSPLWINYGVAEGSAYTVTRIIQALETASLYGTAKPNLIHIIVGNADAIDEGDPLSTTTPTNITTMTQIVESAGIPLIIGTTAPNIQGTQQDPEPDADIELDDTNHWLLGTFAAAHPEVTIINYFTPLTGAPLCGVTSFCGYGSGLSTTSSQGLLIPSAAGYGIMTNLVQPAIEKVAAAAGLETRSAARRK